MSRRFDAIIVGAGQAGPPLAGRLTQAGRTVAMVERKLFGGTCVNAGCTPTKALVASAHAAHLARRGSDFGVTGTDAITMDIAKAKSRKEAIVQQSRNGVESWLRNMEHCTVFIGTASFTAPRQMRVGNEVLEAEQIFLNVGARPTIPDMPGVDTVPYLDSTSILELSKLPKHLIVVGGSYVGLEFAQMYRRFGADVTVVERGPRLVAHEDEDVSACVREILELEGVQIRLDAECIHLESRGSDVVVGLDCEDEHREIVGSHILLAIGRTPNTGDLGASAAGLKLDQHGFIEVDDQLRTNVEGIWALGDCNGKGAFTHTSYNDFEIVAANLIDRGSRRVSDRIPAHALYIDPPLAQIGMTEAQVRRTGRPALMGTRPMTKVGRAVEKGETLGFMKVLVDAESKQILGASIIGTGGDEAIHCILTAMYARQPAELMQHSVHIHPTAAELIPTVFGELKPLK